MRKNSLLIGLGVLEAIAVLVGVYLEPSCGVRGHVHGEPFYDGKSASWWRQELDCWEVRRVVIYRRHSLEWCGSHPPIRVLRYSRQDTWFEEHMRRWMPAHGRYVAFTDIAEMQPRPSLTQGDERALPVLLALFDDPSPKVRLFARIGLGLNPAVPLDEE